MDTTEMQRRRSEAMARAKDTGRTLEEAAAEAARRQREAQDD